MAIPRPSSRVVDEYVAGNTTAISERILAMASTNPALVRAVAEQGASRVARHYCTHETPPGALPPFDTLAEAREAAAAHPGLCGVDLAWIIAAVKVRDVLKRGQQPTATKLRNQACFDAAKAMNTNGRGVQLERCDCFTHACRAIWPGSDLSDDAIYQAFLQTVA
eukprot:jgi/Undpi1/3735/HiC_scaffold_16.g07104.m1